MLPLFADAVVAFPDLGMPAWANTLVLIVIGYLVKHFFPNLVPFLKPVLPNVPFPEQKAPGQNLVALTPEQVMELLRAKAEHPQP